MRRKTMMDMFMSFGWEFDRVGLYKSILKTPFFKMGNAIEKYTEYLISHSLEYYSKEGLGEVKFPFLPVIFGGVQNGMDIFLIVQSASKDDIFSDVNIFYLAKSGKRKTIFKIVTMDCYTLIVVALQTIFIIMEHEEGVGLSPTGKLAGIKDECVPLKFRMFENDRGRVDEIMPPSDEIGLKEWSYHEAMSVCLTAFSFCELLNRPNTHVVRVIGENRKNGKVKYWKESEQHYTFLDFNQKSVKNCGAQDKLPNEIKQSCIESRMVHSRRGHYRKLDSSFFKNKKGQRIWINDMWVGKKEWIGTDQKIYQIVER